MLRIGHGYDVHRLESGRPLFLGGVDIPWEKGLLGHSDADVLLHAVMDAMLGAAAMGDIGQHFSDKDEKWKGISSMILLEKVVHLLRNEGWTPVNIDATILAQQPKLMPYIGMMRGNIADVLGIDMSCVSVKATTEEGLGFTGDGSGIAAHCVVLIEK